ncbi:unnamed protein product [Aspergillus oryzae]|uniref:Unnamed protein product n=1 Tax=Aspergillus oryzae TaxID=5062 RepID=A0AAN4YK07_ASPOZ|nr:unnamed protein product [Aspergillus oryzae]GMF94035.1 unnamed protein product [Aspergillus oryzae]GMG07970.1 unnamed protein product [Aspergillus oryzae]GMG28454.1 unnamed protein product [Aspergillus oryzae]
MSFQERRGDKHIHGGCERRSSPQGPTALIFYILVYVHCPPDGYESDYEVCYKMCEIHYEAPHVNYTSGTGEEGEEYVSFDEMEQTWKEYEVYEMGIGRLGIASLHQWSDLLKA